MNNNALVVVDMQDHFPAALDIKTQEMVVHEIRKAKRRKDLIIILRYTYCGATVPSVLKAVANYGNVIFADKSDDDGTTYIRKHVFNKKLVRICGVNTDYCVAATASGIAYRFADVAVKVILGACNSEYGKPLDRLKFAIKGLPNASILQ